MFNHLAPGFLQLCKRRFHGACRSIVYLGQVQLDFCDLTFARRWTRLVNGIFPRISDEVKQRLETDSYEVGSCDIDRLQSQAIVPEHRHADSRGAGHIGR